MGVIQQDKKWRTHHKRSLTLHFSWAMRTTEGLAPRDDSHDTRILGTPGGMSA